MRFIRASLVFFFSHRTLALARWDFHFILIRFLGLILRRSNAIRRRLEKSPRPLFLNLGSGKRGARNLHWINVDGFRFPTVDFCLDLGRKLPFPDSSANGIFCQHVLEHFDLKKGLAILRECYRVLTPGGVIRLIVPDARKIVSTYLHQPNELLKRQDTNTGLPIEALNSYFRQRYEHQFLYDVEMLRYCLINAGFGGITQVGFQIAGKMPEIVLDDEDYAWESLYMEATKSG